MNLSASTPAGTSRRLVLAALIPLAAFGLQWLFWPVIQPYVWFLFFPAVFFSSWVGGLRGGLVATVLSTGLVWYFFIPPQFSFGIQNPMSAVSIGMFIGMGVLFSLFHHRLRETDRQLAEAVAATRSANAGLEARVLERTAELQQTNAALRASEAQLRMVLQSARAGSWTMDLVLNRTVWSPEFAELYGVDSQRTEPSFEAWLACVHPGDRPRVEAELRDILAARQPEFNLEFRIQHPHKGVRWINDLGGVTYDAAGKPWRVAGINLDITERKRLELALGESEETWRTLFNESADGMILAHPETRMFRSVNRTICRMLGYSAAELLARGVADLHPPADLPAVLEAFQRQARGDLKVATEVPMLRKDGSIFPADVTGAIVVVAGERLLLGAFRDVTERRQAEAELARHRERLEQLVGERTEELTVARAAALSLMQDAQRSERRAAEALAAQRALAAQLEETNRELASFSYSVSHDLRSPLRGIDGFSQVLEEDYADKLDDTGRSHLARVRAAAQRMSGLIDDLLKLSKITRAELHRRPVDLSGLARTIAAELHQREPSRQVRWAIADGLAAEGDPQLLRVALENLLGNAWKFCGRRPDARIEFGITANGPARAFFVRDNGAGFDMVHANKLFGAFQRLHTTVEFEGTGIGLATVSRILHRHGGRVWAEGAVNGGATFYFTL